MLHRQARADLEQRLPVTLIELVEDGAPGGVGNGAVDVGHGAHHRPRLGPYASLDLPMLLRGSSRPVLDACVSRLQRRFLAAIGRTPKRALRMLLIKLARERMAQVDEPE